jgi:hypothetical protein
MLPNIRVCSFVYFGILVLWHQEGLQNMIFAQQIEPLNTLQYSTVAKKLTQNKPMQNYDSVQASETSGSNK